MYDIKGDGKMLITGSASRLYTVYPLEIINAYLLDGWNGFNAYDIFLFVPGAGVRLAAWARSAPDRSGRLRRPGARSRSPTSSPTTATRRWSDSSGSSANNWAFSGKGIWWELDNLIGSTRQRGPNGQIFFLTDQLSDYPDTLRALGFVDRVAAAGRADAGSWRLPVSPAARAR